MSGEATARMLPPHPAPEDPGGLVLEVLRMGPEFPGPAQDLLLAWTLKLPDDADMRQAAARLIEAYGLGDTPSPGDARGQLIALLHEAATGEPPARRRRGGWRGRARPEG